MMPNPTIYRREALALMTAAVALPAQTSEPTKAPSEFFEPHVHFFAPADSKKFPLHADAPYRPTYTFGPEEAVKEFPKAHITRALVVHPEPYQDDLRYLDYCLEVGRGLFRGVALLFPGRESSRTQWDALAKRPIVAVRLHLYDDKQITQLDEKPFGEWIKNADRLGWAVQVHMLPKYAEALSARLKVFPKTRLVIDHLGRPWDAPAKEWERLLKLSEFENVRLKVSGIRALPNTVKEEDLGKWCRRALAVFGVERLIWGAGLATTFDAADYLKTAGRVEGLLGGLNEKSRTAFFSDNARAFYRW